MCMYMYVYLSICMLMYVCMYVCMYVNVCMHVCIYESAYLTITKLTLLFRPFRLGVSHFLCDCKQERRKQKIKTRKSEEERMLR